MNVLIVGASGFVGSYLADFLKKNNYKVFKGLRTSNSSGERGYGDFEDFSKKGDWSDLFKDVDAVVHCAGRVHVMKETSSDPLKEFRKSNVEATKVLAEEAVKAGVKHFIFLSSVKVNGEETFGMPFTEEDVPNPADPYGISKLEAENVLKKISQTTTMKVTVIRPPLIYGPGVKGNIQRLQKVIKVFPIIPLGGIKNQRSVISLLNLCRLIKVTIEQEESSKFNIYLVSDDKDLSTSEMVYSIALSEERKIVLLSIPVRLISFVLNILGKNSMNQRLFGDLRVSCQKAKKSLSYSPEGQFKDNLKS